MKVNMLETQKEKWLRQAHSMAEQTNDWMMIRDYMNNRLGEMKLQRAAKTKATPSLHTTRLAQEQTQMAEVVSQLVEHFHVAEVTAIADLKCSKEIYTTTLAIYKVI